MDVRDRSSPHDRFVGLVFVALHLATAARFAFDDSTANDSAWTGLPLDDAWIHLVYARSVLDLSPGAYNEGQFETGFTSPLWMFLLTPVAALDRLGIVPAAIGAKGLGLGLAMGTSLLAYRLLRRLGRSRLEGALAGGILAIDPSFTFAKLSGMEVIAAVWTLLWALDGIAGQRPLQTGLGLALATLARPENAVFAALAGIVAIAPRLSRENRDVRGIVCVAGPSVALGALWSGYCWMASGLPLPATFYVKSARTLAPFFANLQTMMGPMLFDFPWMTAGSGAVLGTLGALLLVRSGPQRGVCALLVAWPLVHLLVVAATHVIWQWQPFYWERYALPGFAPLLLWIGVGAGALLDGHARSWRILVAGSLIALAVWKLPEKLRQKAERYAFNCQNINEVQVTLGRWLERNSEPGEWIAVNDAGALRYFSHRPVLDLVGLNTSRVLREGWPRVVEEVQPRYLVVFSTWFPDLLSHPGLRQVYSARANPYTICDLPQEEMVVLERLARPFSASAP